MHEPKAPKRPFNLAKDILKLRRPKKMEINKNQQQRRVITGKGAEKLRRKSERESRKTVSKIDFSGWTRRDRLRMSAILK